MARPTRCTLIIDGSCALCRASGGLVARLDPTTQVVDGKDALAQAKGVILVRDGVTYEGIDAVLAWVETRGTAGSWASRLGHQQLVYRFLRVAYRFVARHRHGLRPT